MGENRKSLYFVCIGLLKYVTLNYVKFVSFLKRGGGLNFFNFVLLNCQIEHLNI